MSQFHLSAHRYVIKRYRIFRTNSTTKIALLLLTAGDVNPNPGPKYVPKYPCKVCNKAAKWGQYCIECEQCGSWFHALCTGLSREMYSVLARHPSYTWICCDCGLPNFGSSLFKADIKTYNSFDPLSDMSDGSDLICSLPSVNDFSNPNKAAKWGQYCIECEQCGSWFHALCTGLSREMYSVLARHPSYTWICCDCGLPNFGSSLFKADIKTYNSFDPLSDMSDGSDLICSLPSVNDFSNPNKAAKWGQYCIECEQCGSWFHALCTGLSREMYSVLARHPSYTWICCDCGLPNFGSSLFKADIKTYNSFDPLSDMSDGSDLICSLPSVNDFSNPIRTSSPRAFYRSQKTGTDYLRLLEDSLRQIPSNASIWLLGDFNLPDINWDTASFTLRGRYPGPSKLMLDLAVDYNLLQVVKKPTRENNILDLCFTNDPSFVTHAQTSAHPPTN
ncbi:hypothetical protein HOLleu_42043 [Holothuria leucospilota]|uniref:PHD-type domain-containing protein n=1 Tax=Holothuria leucospilota TaxID=206669 RepID=A0A9Q0YAX5_HOLLE|nr:hypothetical protein HOLleu_42043 [Holothuria leucospilota]